MAFESRYNPPRGDSWRYNPKAVKPYEISRSKIDLFMNCPRCFYLDAREGIGHPPTPPFSLNSAVDELLKKEFDIHRANKSAHPLMKEYGIDAVPYQTKLMDEWRDALRGGVRYLHEPTNFIVKGGLDDVWVNPNDELIVVDYKATSKKSEVNLDAEWQIGYKRQVEVYQWLLRKNGYKVDNTAYFVYCNGDADKEAFDGKLEFSIKVIPHKGDDSWVEGALLEAKKTLDMDIEDMMVMTAKKAQSCDYCKYREAIRQVQAKIKKSKGKIIK